MCIKEGRESPKSLCFVFKQKQTRAKSRPSINKDKGLRIMEDFNSTYGQVLYSIRPRTPKQKYHLMSLEYDTNVAAHATAPLPITTTNYHHKECERDILCFV